MIRRRCGVWILFLAWAGVSATSTAQQEAPLDNAQIIRLTKLDMGDAVIMAKIKSAKEVRFETSTDDLVNRVQGWFPAHAQGQAVLFDFGIDK